MAQFTDKIEPKDFPKMPKEYQDLLTRLLTIQADCEIGGPHIYVDHWTLRAPPVDDQWRVARIAAEGIDHCPKMLRLLGLIGSDRTHILTRPRSKREGEAFKEDMPTRGGAGQRHPEGRPRGAGAALGQPERPRGRETPESGGGGGGGPHPPLSSLQPRDRPRRFACRGRPWRPSRDPLRGPHAHVRRA